MAAIAVVCIIFLLKKSNRPRDYTDVPKILAEVDIYIKYGKKDQARQLLIKCLEHSPNNRELKKALQSI